MNIVLGFGSTEQQFVRDEEAAILAHVEETAPALCPHYFTDEYTRQFKDWLEERGKALRAKAAEYKTASDYPDRYSDYLPYVVADANYIVVILSIMHTNRRHALSPDGWAGLSERAVFTFWHLDVVPFVTAEAEEEAA